MSRTTSHLKILFVFSTRNTGLLYFSSQSTAQCRGVPARSLTPLELAPAASPVPSRGGCNRPVCHSGNTLSAAIPLYLVFRVPDNSRTPARAPRAGQTPPEGGGKPFCTAPTSSAAKTTLHWTNLVEKHWSVCAMQVFSHTLQIPTLSNKKLNTGIWKQHQRIKRWERCVLYLILTAFFQSF